MAPSIESISNPYAAGSSAAATEGGFEGAPRERVGRSFRFNTKGKYVQIANQLRQDAQLEELKQRIAQSARKAGLDTEFETLEKNIKVCSHWSGVYVRLNRSSIARGAAGSGVVGCGAPSEQELR